jgi:hypothetical protein
MTESSTVETLEELKHEISYTQNNPTWLPFSMMQITIRKQFQKSSPVSYGVMQDAKTQND